jgi:hypothetical protein
MAVLFDAVAVLFDVSAAPSASDSVPSASTTAKDPDTPRPKLPAKADVDKAKIAINAINMFLILFIIFPYLIVIFIKVTLSLVTS